MKRTYLWMGMVCLLAGCSGASGKMAYKDASLPVE